MTGVQSLKRVLKKDAIPSVNLPGRPDVSKEPSSRTLRQRSRHAASSVEPDIEHLATTVDIGRLF